MFKKLIPLLLFVGVIPFFKAQNEFVTLWKPSTTLSPIITVDAPYQANSQQIWFPGIGQNYNIDWEEVNYPQHNGTLANVTSTKQVLIDFGIPLTPNGTEPVYKVKVTNGDGVFQQMKFGEVQLITIPDSILPIWQMSGSADKIVEIAQWGDIGWTSMENAFANCKLLQITATDVPNLSNVTDASFMFFATSSFTGAPSMQNWNTSHIQNFRFMFAKISDFIGGTFPDLFNPPYFSSWNMSSATNLSYMFAGRTIFNQPLSGWNVSNVTDTSWMFAQCLSYNQRMDGWNTSSLENMSYMFHVIPVFNQSLKNWNTSNVTNMAHVFHGCSAFNQSLESWDVTNVTHMDMILNTATSYNQSLGNWNLASLVDGKASLVQTALSCDNYSKTLAGWANNPNTVNNIDLGSVTPLKYAANVVDKRNILLNKGWIINGDSVGTCFLNTGETKLSKKLSIYPNPAADNLHFEGIQDIQAYKIIDASGRIIKEGNPNKDMIDISSLTKGNYILQLVLKNEVISSKFIKK